MKNSTTFRVKGNKKRGTYILTRAITSRDGVLKKISYRPGANSIYDEDNKDSAAKPKSVVFKYNEKKHDPALEITVSHKNKLLLDFLKAHPRFSVDYEIYDAEKLANDKVVHYDNVEKALGYVTEGDENRTKAAALAVLGESYFSKSASICKADLKEKAYKEPSYIIKVYESPNFENRYLASLLYCSGIIKNNTTHSAVQWSDNENTILAIAPGESGIDKLTEYLSRSTPESQILLQSFGARLDALRLNNNANSVNSENVIKELKAKEKELDAKDKEIEELKRQLAAKNTATTENDIDVKDIEQPGLTIEEARSRYEEKFKTSVPARFLNDLNWITKKLSETVNT